MFTVPSTQPYMSRRQQKTIAESVSLEGVGVHSNVPATLRICPADPDTGIRFKRMDLDGQPEIRADLDAVAGTSLGTSLGADDVRILTVEHVMAALSVCGVSNVLLELTGPEPPILDGSFKGYCDAINSVGTVDQEGKRLSVLAVQSPITLTLDTGESYVVTPADDFRISATIEFEHPSIGRQFGSFPISSARFQSDIAPARTFGFESDAEALRERGVALGSSLENTVVLGPDGILNDDLRFEDEFLRHKVGDLVGDLALLGCDVLGHIVAERPSHTGNIELARQLRQHVDGAGNEPIVDAQKIMQYLPHRYPMLLVDRIIEFESGKRIVGIKNVTINEPFFQGHYPDHPIMPGVLIIEAMAQVGGLLLMDAVENPEEKVVYFMSLDKVKWRRPVLPGDRIVFELEMVQFRRHVCKMRGVGRVDGFLVAEADLMARIVER